MLIPLEPLRFTQPERGDETDLCALYLCNGYSTDQVYVLFDFVFVFYVHMSAFSLLIWRCGYMTYVLCPDVIDLLINFCFYICSVILPPRLLDGPL